jgi:hypothetical protein
MDVLRDEISCDIPRSVLLLMEGMAAEKNVEACASAALKSATLMNSIFGIWS